MPELSLILPVLDEESLIEQVVSNIVDLFKENKIDYEIILVENGSTDNSWQVITRLSKNNSRIIAIKTDRGYGSAVLAGLRSAKGKWVSYMPSDGQIDAAILPVLFHDIQNSQYHLVKIKRINRESMIRYIRSKIFNILARIFYPIDMVDINGSPRIFERKFLKILELSYIDSFIDTEFAVKSHLLGWKVKEVPMKNLERIGGKSTVKLNTTIEFLTNLWNFRFDSSLNKWKRKYITR